MTLFAGAMSGTSLDGIDVAIVELGGVEEKPEPARLVAFHSEPYEPDFRARLLAACGETTASEICELDFELGRRFAVAVTGVLERTGLRAADVRAIGSHGQTLWHRPPDDGPGSTLQIGQPAVIAEETGIEVIADLRSRDVAAGGHGAPLTAYFDRLLLGSASAARAIQNLGGIGNVTALPRERGSDDPIAFDTGPGVMLLDACAVEVTAGRLSCDLDGELAARGHVDEAALAEWLADPFFARPPPRTTGREHFGHAALGRWLARHPDLSAETLLATLTELTARSIAAAYALVPFDIEEVWLCGGGARNPQLRRRIGEAVAPRPVGGTEALGWDPDAREAAAFALFARQHLLGHPASPDWATGAAGPRLIGVRVPA